MAPKKWRRQKQVGKGSKTCPSLWCHVCGWVHFNCSGLKNKTDYHEFFLCAKCSKNRVIIEDDDLFAVAYAKIHNPYRNPKKSTAIGSRQNLLRATKCSTKHVDRSLNSSETYTKFKLTRKRFPRQGCELSPEWNLVHWFGWHATTCNRKIGSQVSLRGSGQIDSVPMGNGPQIKDFESLYQSTEKNNCHK